MKTKILGLIAAAIAFTYSAKAQESFSADQQAALDVVVKLFDGMRAGDSAVVHSVFRDGVELHTSFTNKNTGKPMLVNDELQPFLDAVGTPHDEVWDAVIWGEKVLVDGNLAMVWCDYAFYAGNNFSHCGVDAFMLNKDEEGWKIFHLTDTRRRANCEVPDNLKK